MLTAFLLAALASFIGSLQPGPVNLAVGHAALQSRYNHAFWIAIAGSLPELPACALALLGWDWAAQYPKLQQGLQAVVALLLVAVGGLLLLRATQVANPAPATSITTPGFVKGLLLAGANPQLITYWVVLTGYLRSIHGLATGWAPQVGYCIGAGVGAFAVHVSLISLVKRNSQLWSLPLRRNLIRAIGLLLLALGLQQAYIFAYGL